MRIYIASSWKNQHAVELLSDLLEDNGHTVISFVAARRREEGGTCAGPMDLDAWIISEAGRQMFHHDLDGACRSELVIYLGPSGTDAWAEVGAAWASGVPIVGLLAKGETSGLMRRMVSRWFSDHRELLRFLEDVECPDNMMKISIHVEENGERKIMDVSPPPCVGVSVCGGGCESCPAAVKEQR